MVKNLFESVMNKNCKKQIKHSLELKKQWSTLWKAMIIPFKKDVVT